MNRTFTILMLAGAAALAVLTGVAVGYEPGDVNGDGVVDAQDLACAAVTVYDPNNGCAASTQSPLQNVIRVSPTGGDFALVQAAIDSITDAAEDNRYLIQIGPGVYVEQVTMQPFIDLEGAGQEVTTLRWSTGGTHDGTVLGADDAELRLLTIERDGASPAIAMLNDATSPRLDHVTMRASGGISVALANLNGASPVITHCRLEAPSDFATGVTNRGGAPRFESVVIEVQGGDPIGIDNRDGSKAAFLDVDVRVVGTGGTAYGVMSEGSAPSFRSGSVSVSELEGEDVDTAYGIAADGGGWSIVVESDITVKDADSNFGIHLTGARLDLSLSRLTVSGLQPTGIRAEASSKGSSLVDVRRSTIEVNLLGVFHTACPAAITDGGKLLLTHSDLLIDNLTDCGSGALVRANNASDNLVIRHCFIAGFVSETSGASTECLAVSHWGIDPAFYTDTCP